MTCDSFQASSASDELRISSVFSVSGNSSDAVSGESTKIYFVRAGHCLSSALLLTKKTTAVI